jgi:hypothetical protein
MQTIELLQTDLAAMLQHVCVISCHFLLYRRLLPADIISESGFES